MFLHPLYRKYDSEIFIHVLIWPCVINHVRAVCAIPRVNTNTAGTYRNALNIQKTSLFRVVETILKAAPRSFEIRNGVGSLTGTK